MFRGNRVARKTVVDLYNLIVSRWQGHGKGPPRARIGREMARARKNNPIAISDIHSKTRLNP